MSPISVQRLSLAKILGTTILSSAILLFANSTQAQIDYSHFDIRKARDVAVSPSGTLWMIGPEAGANASIQRLVGSALVTQPGAAVRVAVDPSGSAWVVNGGGDLYHWQKNGSAPENWVLQSLKAMDVAVGGNGAVWAIGTDHRIMRFANGTWTAISGGGDRIAVDPSGNPWVTNQGNDIWRWNGSAWSLLPGKAQDIAIAPDGTVFVVGMGPKPGGFQIYRLNGNSWAEIPGAAGIAVAATNRTLSLAQPADNASQVVAVNVPVIIQPPQVINVNPAPVITQPTTPILLQGTTSIAVSGPGVAPSTQPAQDVVVNGIRRIFVRDQTYEVQVLKALNYGMYGSQIFLGGQAPMAASLSPLERGMARLTMAAAEAYYTQPPQSVTPEFVLSQLSSVTRGRDGILANLAVLLIAKMTDQSRDPETVALRTWVTDLYRAEKINAAKGTLDQYLLWKNDPCGYEKKAAGECMTMANLFTTRTPPQDMIALNATGAMFSTNTGQVVAAATAGAAAVTAAMASALVASALGVVVIPGSVTTSGVVISQVATSLFAAFGGTGGAAGGGAGAIGAAGIAGAVAAPIAAAVLAIVVGTTEGFKVVEAMRVEPMLRLKLGSAMSENIVIENALTDQQAVKFFYLGFYNAVVNHFATPVANVDGDVRFYNQGGYMARFKLAYVQNGVSKSQSTDALAVGHEASFVIPASATNVVASGEYLDVSGWKSLFTRTLGRPTVIGFTSYGTVFGAAVKDEYPEISNIIAKPNELTVTQGGGYVARVRVAYTQAGREVVAVDNSDLGAGWRQVFTIPTNATNIHVQAWTRTGLVWDPWKAIIDKSYPSPPNECIKVYGTTLDPKWNNECN